MVHPRSVVDSIAMPVAAGVFLGSLAVPAVAAAPLPVIAVAVALVLGGSLVLRWRDFGLCLLVFTSYIRLSDGLIDTLGIEYVFEGVVAVALAILAYRILKHGGPRGLALPAATFVFFFSVAAVSLVVAVDLEIVRKLLTDMAKDVLIALVIVALCDRPKAFIAAIWSLIGAGALLGSLTVIQQVTGTFDQTYLGLAVAEVRQIVEGTEGIRAGGPVASTNFYAMIMVALLPLALDRAWNAGTRSGRALATLSAALIGAAILLTLSRGGLVAMGFVLIVMAAWRLRRPSFYATLIAVGLVGGWAMSDAAVQRFQTIVALVPGSGEDAVAQSQFAGRASEMLAAVHMFSDHPWIGVGLGNFNVHYVDYSRSIGWDPRREDRSAHSLYLETAAEGGILGLAALVTLLAGAYVTMGRSRRWAERAGDKSLGNAIAALEIGLGGYLVASVLLHDAFPRYMWILAALAFTTARVVQGMGPVPAPQTNDMA